MPEIEQRGLHTCLHEALQRVAGGDFGISIDMDVFEPGEAPGVDCPQPGGIQSRVLLAELRGMARHPHCVGLEITEYNPHRDSACRTGRLARDLLETLLLPESADLRQWEAEHGAHNYAPLPVMLARGEGSWLWDAEGRAYIDMMSAYSAVSFGHSNPRLVAALESQARRLAVTSRAYHTDRLPLLLKRLSEITGYDQVLPMNSGAEAVETALKAARKWGHQIKGIAEDQVEIIGCAGNFHGRTIAIIGLSTEPQYRKGFGAFPPGLKCVPYGDAAALEAAITPNTAAFLVEPIQGEGGILVPPAGYLKACAEICKKHDVLLIADEVQTGLGRTGALLACEHEGVRPDGVCLGKALGGGLLPVSAFIADRRLMRVFTPGDHGSTFGGNALAAAVALEALDLLVDENLVERAQRLGEHLMRGLNDLKSPLIRDIRGRGLLTGIEIDPAYASAREICEALAAHGVLTKDTHGTVIRLAPALTIGEDVLELALERIAETLQEFEHRVPRRA
jgi:ornithine--oxo-acid transaminase